MGPVKKTQTKLDFGILWIQLTGQTAVACGMLSGIHSPVVCVYNKKKLSCKLPFVSLTQTQEPETEIEQHLRTPAIIQPACPADPEAQAWGEAGEGGEAAEEAADTFSPPQLCERGAGPGATEPEALLTTTRGGLVPQPAPRGHCALKSPYAPHARPSCRPRRLPTSPSSQPASLRPRRRRHDSRWHEELIHAHSPTFLPTVSGALSAATEELV